MQKNTNRCFVTRLSSVFCVYGCRITNRYKERT